MEGGSYWSSVCLFLTPFPFSSPLSSCSSPLLGLPSSFIDASMRELRFSGFQSNRSRQNVASFLTSDLIVDWRCGAEIFEEELVDYDTSSNWGNWQYGAGVGTDPRENRYFNPISAFPSLLRHLPLPHFRRLLFLSLLNRFLSPCFQNKLKTTTLTASSSKPGFLRSCPFLPNSFITPGQCPARIRASTAWTRCTRARRRRSGRTGGAIMGEGSAGRGRRRGGMGERR